MVAAVVRPLVILLLTSFGVWAQENGEGVERVADTKVSIDSGFFVAPISVTIASATEGARILYTTDGSEPDLGTIFSGPNGITYSEPIAIDTTTVLRVKAFGDAGVLPTNTDTRTYLFLDDVIQQPAEIEGWPRPDLSVGQGSRQHDYEMDPRVVGVGEQAEAMKQSLLAIPTMTLVVDPESMWNAAGNGGFYRGDHEEAAHVEILYPDAPEQRESIRCAVQGHSHDRLKRSLRLKFKAEFGDTKFETDLLRRSEHNTRGTPDRFDRLILRAGNNRSWARSWNPDKTAYTMDEWYRSTQIAMSGYGSRGAFVHLYINGLYWGLYNVCERPDRWFTSEHFGGEVEDWFAISHGGSQGGDNARWNALLSDSGTELADPENYSAFEEKIDVAGFIDYLLLSWYINLTDWPQNNWWAGVRTEPPGQVRFFAWDGEWSFGLGQSPGRAWVHPDFRRGGGGSSPTARLWRAARENEDFMVLVADRAHQHLVALGGELTDPMAQERWGTLNKTVEEAVLAESARWGDALSPSQPRTVSDDWQNEVDRVHALMVGNGALLIEQLREEDYYPDLGAPVIAQASGWVEPGSRVSLENPNGKGTIYYTLDGTDPRAVGGGIGETAMEAGGPVVMESSATFKTRIVVKSIFGGETWSPLLERNYYTEIPALRVSELMYHPSAPTDAEIAAGFVNDDDFEYLELINVGATPLSLEGIRFIDGVIFEFDGQSLGPGERAVIVRDAAAFQYRFGTQARVLGEYAQQLSNGGERIELRGAYGESILAFAYEDDWQESTDGGGRSLEFARLDAETSEWAVSTNWGVSENGGSPGAEPGNPPASSLELRVQSLSGEAFVIVVAGRQETEHIVESSTDLITWAEAFRTTTDESGIKERTIALDPEDRVTRYYRAREVMP